MKHTERHCFLKCSFFHLEYPKLRNNAVSASNIDIQNLSFNQIFGFICILLLISSWLSFIGRHAFVVLPAFPAKSALAPVSSRITRGSARATSPRFAALRVLQRSDLTFTRLQQRLYVSCLLESN